MSDLFLYIDKFYLDQSERGFVVKFVKDKNDALEQPELPQGYNYGMSPFTAKELLSVLYMAVSDYERDYGVIKLDSSSVQKVQRIMDQKREPIGFRSKRR